MTKKDIYQESLEYHSTGRKGKIEVIVTKPFETQKDLSLAYSPGVARPCEEIAKDPEAAYEYTAKGNLVAVISNGTAVLGLGDIGALAGKPVMEGKGSLFKKFADIDVFDIELQSKDKDEIVRTCELISPTFGGINLEDIGAPDCFYIEETLQEKVDIPVFHDDQHGTAIISAAALLNAIEITGKDISKIKAVFNGAGAAGIACAQLFVDLGLRKENLVVCDSKGTIYKGRTQSMNPYKERFAVETDARTLEEAMVGADLFCGVSVAGAVTKEMLKTMAPNPIVFAMANPEPEITYPDAVEARPDCIMATGRSDYPNQVNNVLCFPFLFRGALDVRATKINAEMKIAAVRAIAALAKEEVPDSVLKAYGVDNFEYGKEYIIPKPFDPRALLYIAPAVAKAAMDTGVARKPIKDFDAYREQLESTLGRSKAIMRYAFNQVKKRNFKVAFPEGANETVIRAVGRILDENLVHPVLLGDKGAIGSLLEKHAIDVSKVTVIDPQENGKSGEYAQSIYEKRQRKGMTISRARDLMHKDTGYYGAMMLEKGDVDGLISGQDMSYPDGIRPILTCIKNEDPHGAVAGVYMMVFKGRTMFFADTTVNIDPSAEQLAKIAISVSKFVKEFAITPKVAMLSFSNFGSAPVPESQKIAKATALVKEWAPDLEIDGEMQGNIAFNEKLRGELFPFSTLKGEPNILIFPDLGSANIAYKLLMRTAEVDAIGPILVGLDKSAHVLERGSTVEDIVNLTALAGLKAIQHNS
ncbi:malic protein NAD-binding protein [Desulfurispirillum indicum S5]|uniref:Malic protein NAD-binding protein n=1 Tax=Desulfurispirillum indicum (strain ATCC BAA-1389 / DSM 22839 / S5) TaxID=653733 RepID=E6W6R1_DESIS|nr:NADP-dependent malic enzyme [Desulfurispirillum indicum]ADU65061.1 malic protein NAD-binding protein [Desulfurispirillum indicum S5]